MKIKTTWLLILAAISITTFWSCGSDTEVGAGVLGDQDLTIKFRDDLALSAKTVESDPVVTFTRINFLSTARLIGELDDPIFGRSSSTVYAQVVMQPNNPPDFETATQVDSAVLVLNVVPDDFYGDPNAIHDVEIIRVVEPLDIADTIFSDQSYATNGQVLGSVELIPSRIDSVRLRNLQVVDSVDFIENAFALTLSRAFTAELFNDRTADDSPEAFQEFLNGIQIKSTVRDGASSMFSLDLSSNGFNSTVVVYYKDAEGANQIYRYFLTTNQSFRPTQFIHDYTDTDIVEQLDVNVEGDEPLYVQGMAGTNVEVDLSSFMDMDQDILINLAELEFFLATDLSGDTTDFKPVQTMGLFHSPGGQILERITDLQNAAVAQRVETFFKGGLSVDSETSGLKYTMNMTSHLKEIQAGRLDPIVILSVVDKSQQPNRSVLYGPNHSQFPAKLKLTFTEPQ